MGLHKDQHRTHAVHVSGVTGLIDITEGPTKSAKLQTDHDPRYAGFATATLA